MSSRSIHTLAEITGSQLLSEWPEDNTVTRLLFDSRKLTIAQGTLFIAIPGRTNDGHRYAEGLYERGVRHFLVSKPITLPGPANILLASDSIKALQDIAAFHRRQLPGKVLAITGSNGKTIIKEWLFQCLMEDMAISRSPKSYNSQIGVPLSLWMMEPYHKLGIIEAGISQPGEMEHLEQIIQPDYGILTNIGPAHGEKFEGLAHKLQEKLRLFLNAKALIYCSNDSAIRDAVEKFLPPEVIRFSWGYQGEQIRVTEVTPGPASTAITIQYQNQIYRLSIPFLDEASIENALHTYAGMIFLGIAPDIAASRLANLQPLEMRLEMKEAINRCALINDSYSSDLASFAIALDFLQHQDKNREPMVILSDILQSDMPAEELYQEVARQIKGKGIQKFIGIGDGFTPFQNLFPAESKFFPSTEDFLQAFNLASLKDLIILVKGARSFGFERIANKLQLKAHETALYINLQAIVHNLNFYRSQVDAGTRIMAMVKAFGYGSGSWEVAALLQFHRIDYLAVAYPDEGIALRQSGIELPIMVMNPSHESLLQMLRYDLEPEIYSNSLLGHLIVLLQSTPDLVRPVKIHLKVDTGMHRLGFLPNEIEDLVKVLQNAPDLRVASVFSHLAASEDPAEDSFTILQATRFKHICEELQEKLGYPFIRHLLNTSGISRFPEYQFDMVRPGIGLYGFSPCQVDQAHLENVMTLRSVVSQIKSIPTGETVGYNRRWTASRDSLIAIVPIGYADGVDRRLGQNKGSVMIRGQRAPIIGHVCMDMIMVDVSELQVSEGDEVILFGEGISIAEVARSAQTIPYEILTGISARVKRIYFNE